MPRVNKFLVPLILVLVCAIGLAAQQQAPSSTPIGSQEPMSQPPVAHPNPQPPANEPQQQQAPAPSNQPSDTVRVPQQQGAPVDQESGAFIIRKRVEEVTLHATVVDDRQRLITDLDKTAFAVFEDGQPQQITSFGRSDVPVSVGILIDNSGSMREKRPSVNQAAFQEWGANALSLNVQQQTTTSVRTVLGADLGGAIGLGDTRTLDIALRLGWLHEYASTARPITAAFAGAPSANFTVYGATPQRDAAVIGFQAATAVAAGTQLYLRYDGDIGSGTDNHAFNVGLRLSW